MSNRSALDKAGFDEYAADYDVALAHGLSVSGEDKDYFAHGRVSWLARWLGKSDIHCQRVMDFGCGTGSATPHLFGLLAAGSLVGVDTSAKSLQIARQRVGSEQTRFLLLSEYQPREQIDLVFSNGVFHHVPPPQRPAAVDYVRRSLKPGGLFAVWENNPWNPGAHYVMSRIPFDRDAIMISSAEMRRLLKTGGFDVVRTDYLFIFPRLLSSLRPVERFVSRLPLGAQYQVLARKI